MKITRLKLVNFIGIKIGMDLDEIELDFTKGNNKIVMLRGGNGSGKTTLMRQLNPFKGDKSDLILEGLDGRKEIDISNGADYYEIVHVYAKAGQSFIKKNGVELNPNGGLGTFKEILFTELGVDESFKSIGSIGNNASSFIEMKPADRKKYIANLIGTEEYDEAYEIVNSKYNELRKDIKKTGDELSKYSDQKILEDQLALLEKAIEDANIELTKLYNEQGSLTNEIQHNIDDMGSDTVSSIDVKINEKKNIISTTTNTRNSLLQELTDINVKDSQNDQKNFAKSRALEIQEEISEINGKLGINNSNKSHYDTLIAGYKNKISSTQIEIENLGDPEKLEKILKEISNKKARSDELRNEIKKLSDCKNPAITARGKGVNYITNSVQRFKDFTDFIEKYYTDLSAHNLSANRSNISYFFDSDFKESLERQTVESRNVISSKKAQLEDANRELADKSAHICDVENLNKRPDACKIDDCPFIKTSLKYKNVLNEIKNVEDKISSLKKDLDTLEIKAENLISLKTLYISFNDSYNRLQPRDNDVFAFFLKEHTLEEWLNGSLSDFQEYRQRVIDDTNHGLEVMQEYVSLVNTLSYLDREKTTAELSDAALRNKYQADIDDATEKLNEAMSKYNELVKEGAELSNQLEEKRNLMQKYNDFSDALSQKLSAETQLSDYNKTRDKLVRLDASKTESTNKLDNVHSKIKEITAARNNDSASKIQVDNALNIVRKLNDTLSKLNKIYTPTEAVKNSLDSKCGIPLVLIDTYLVETESIVNRLLDAAFNGRFQIKFITSDKEFSIRIIKDGLVKSDISVASQGETSITTISLCLALIQQSLKSYNIVCLDEIDGALDIKNRRNFINILNSQISTIGIEQIFIISHNDEFDAADVDLILLKDHGVDTNNRAFMTNKNVIYEYKGD